MACFRESDIGRPAWLLVAVWLKEIDRYPAVYPDGGYDLAAAAPMDGE